MFKLVANANNRDALIMTATKRNGKNQLLETGVRVAAHRDG